MQLLSDEIDCPAGAPRRHWFANDALRGHRIERTRTLSGGYRDLQLVTDTCKPFVLRRFLRGHGNMCATEVVALDPQAATPASRSGSLLCVTGPSWQRQIRAYVI
jgi:hypothetical protein